MQERTKGDVENDTSKENVDDSLVPQLNEVEEQEEVAEEIKQEIQMYSPESFPATLLPSSNSFTGLQETVNALDAMDKLAGVLIKSLLCPLKKKEDITIAIITGNQFNFPFMTSINNIFPINGKPTLSVHLQRALILRNKVIFNKIYDFEPLYDWAKIVDGNVAKGANNQPIILGRFTVKDKPLEPCVASPERDRITKYQFKRLIKLEDGSFEKLEVFSEFKMSDADKAGLLGKDVWIKYPSRMCDARAFAIGSREIASDITLGISTVSELADINNVKYSVSENLEETVIIS